MGKHAKFSPSSAHRWTECPGSIALGEYANSIYPPKQNEYASAGIRAHSAAERALVNDSAMLDALPEDEQRAVRTYVDYVSEIQKNCSIYVPEYRLAATIDDEEVFGTADFFGVSGTTMHIVDYKHGQHVEVDIHNNKQLLLYAVLALDMQDEAGRDIENVHLAIVQPRVDTFEPIKEVTLDAFELAVKWKPFYRNAIKRAKLNPDMCIPGDWCRWCNGQPVCPELNKKAFALAKPEIMDKLSATNTAQLAKILSHEKQMNELFARAKEIVKQKLMDGVPVPGWKLVESRTHRKWKSGAEETLKDEVEAFEVSLKSPAKISKELPSLDISDLTERPYALTIAPEDDKRPAVDVVIADFKEEF